MNRDEARQILRAQGVPDSDYSFDERVTHDTTVLIQRDGVWVKYVIDYGRKCPNEDQFEFETDACEYLVDTLVRFHKEVRLGGSGDARPLKHREYVGDFDREYLSEWIEQFGIDRAGFDLSGMIADGKYVIQPLNGGWKIWLEDHGKKRHAAWSMSTWFLAKYIVAKLQPQPWKIPPRRSDSTGTPERNGGASR